MIATTHSYFYPPIYLVAAGILLFLFFCTRNRKLELLIGLAILLIAAFGFTHYSYGEDVRDANGKLLTTSSKANKVEIVREAGTGRITETRQTSGTVTTVRDANGRILRTERRK